jgi:hypothetical protein
LLSTPGKLADPKEIFEIEDKLNELSKVLTTDLINRENFISDLSLFISEEKNEYFSYQDRNNFNK